MDVTNNPHDKYFREVFSKKQNTIDLLKNSIPEDIFKEIDFDSFEYSNKSYIDEDLKDIESDLVIKTKFNKEDCWFYILFEHKSYSDRFALFQLLKYMIKIWDNEHKDKKKHFSPIIPILFYQSGYKWAHGNNFSMYFNSPNDLLKKYLPDINYQIYDLAGLSDEEIKGNLWYVASMRLMKHIHNLKPMLKDIYEYISKNIDMHKEYPIELITITVYLLNACNTEDEVYVKTILTNDMEDLYMSIAKKIKDEGILEGKREGILEGKREGILEGEKKGEYKKAIETAKNLKKLGMDDEKISQVTGLSLEEVKKL